MTNYSTKNPTIWNKTSSAAADFIALQSQIHKSESQVNPVLLLNLIDDIVRALLQAKDLIDTAPQTQAEEEFQAKLPTFLKIGDRIINPSLVTAFQFEEMEPIEEGDPKESKMEVWFSDDSSLCFYDKEAEVLKSFLLAGSRTYDLNDLFG